MSGTRVKTKFPLLSCFRVKMDLEQAKKKNAVNGF